MCSGGSMCRSSGMCPMCIMHRNMTTCMCVMTRVSCMGVVPVAIMRTMSTMIIVMVIIVSHLTVFFFAELIGLVPRRLDEYLECRVQVYYEYE